MARVPLWLRLLGCFVFSIIAWTTGAAWDFGALLSNTSLTWPVLIVAGIVPLSRCQAQNSRWSSCTSSFRGNVWQTVTIACAKSWDNTVSVLGSGRFFSHHEKLVLIFSSVSVHHMGIGNWKELNFCDHFLIVWSLVLKFRTVKLFSQF